MVKSYLRSSHISLLYLVLIFFAPEVVVSFTLVSLLENMNLKIIALIHSDYYDL